MPVNRRAGELHASIARELRQQRLGILAPASSCEGFRC